MGIVGYKGESSEFPVKTVEEIKLDCLELKSTNNESIYKENVDLIKCDWPNSTCTEENVEAISSFIYRKSLPAEMSKRLKFSQYIIDPNKFRFIKVIRVVALVMLFIKKVKKCGKFYRAISQKIHRAQVCKTVLQNLSNDFKSTEYLVTSGTSHKINTTGREFKCKQGLVIILTDAELGEALDYYF